jgi:hypothetical protein
MVGSEGHQAWFTLFVTAFAVTVTALVFAEQWSDAVAALAAFVSAAVVLGTDREGV